MSDFDRSPLPYSRPALLIVNPVSGKKLVLRYIPEIVRSLMDANYLVTVCVTRQRGEATRLAQELGANYELICCAGGDGTLNETISGVALSGLDVPLGYIPCGSTNDFAQSHSLATDISEAAKNIASGRQTRYDIGRWGQDRYFTYVAAFGAFSWLSYTTDQNMKNLLGHTAYILDGIKDLPKIKPEHVVLTADGVRYEGDYIFGAICNSLSVAGTFELSPDDVNTADGVFEMLLIKSPKTLMDLDAIVRGLLNQDYSCSFIDFCHVRHVEVENPPGLEWSLDGESSGVFEKATVELLPRFLNLQG